MASVNKMLKPKIRSTMLCVLALLVGGETYSIASQKSKWVRVITDANQITNYLDFDSIALSYVLNIAYQVSTILFVLLLGVGYELFSVKISGFTSETCHH